MPAKFRENKFEATATWTQYDASGNVTKTGDISGEIVTERKHIIYENSGQTRSNACRHVQIALTDKPHSYNLVWRSDGKVRQKDVGVRCQMSYNNWWRSRAPALHPIYGIETPVGFLGRAYSALQPRIDGDVNAVNFLLELRDFKRMFTSIVQTIKLLKKWETYSALAEANLNWSFAWKPAFNDILAFAKSYSAFKARMNNITNAFGTERVHRYSEVISHPDESVLLHHTKTYMSKRVMADFDVTYNCTVKYIITPLAPGSAPPTFKNYMKSLGFRPSMATVWNAIPFSFVIDWFYKVGSFLQASEGRIPCKVEILDACVSQKSVEKSRLSFMRPTKLGDLWYDTEMPNFGQCTMTHYYREVIYPSELKFAVTTPRFDNVDIRELVLSLSLLIRIGKVKI